MKVDVSTYEHPDMWCVEDQMAEDLRDIAVHNKENTEWNAKVRDEIEVQWIWRVDRDYIKCEWNLDWENFKKDVAACMAWALKKAVDLKTIFAKYGLEYTGMSFYTPQFYNYENDSLEIKLKTTEDTNKFDVDKYWLRELIEEYIENVRQESYDWYMSLEPTSIEKVEFDDYCTIWAILKKENIFDNLKQGLEDFMKDWYYKLIRQNSSPIYKVKVYNGKEKWYGLRGVDWPYKDFNWIDCSLDYNTQQLIPIKKA